MLFFLFLSIYGFDWRIQIQFFSQKEKKWRKNTDCKHRDYASTIAVSSATPQRRISVQDATVIYNSKNNKLHQRNSFSINPSHLLRRWLFLNRHLRCRIRLDRRALWWRRNRCNRIGVWRVRSAWGWRGLSASVGGCYVGPIVTRSSTRVSLILRGWGKSRLRRRIRWWWGRSWRRSEKDWRVFSYFRLFNDLGFGSGFWSVNWVVVVGHCYLVVGLLLL